VSVKIEPPGSLPLKTLEKWIAESYRLMAPNKKSVKR